MIEISNMKKSFYLHGTEVPILDIKEWNVNKGQRIAIIGPSGCGKSTLLHLLGGVIAVDRGELAVASKPLHSYTESQRDAFRAANVGYIFQDFHLISSLTAKQNVELVLPRKLGAKEKRDLIHQWFEKVGLQDRMNHLPSQLSRGQQQRVAIIRALINNPPIILADEPTGSLDWETAGEIMNLLLELCETEGSTLITVTHDLHLAKLFPAQVHMTDINVLGLSDRDKQHSNQESKGEKVG